MLTSQPHHSSLHGADSLSYTNTNINNSVPGPHTYEQRAEASGLGGERYRAGAEGVHPTQTAAHEKLAHPSADGSRHKNPDGTYRSDGPTARKEGTVASGNPELKQVPRRRSSVSSASSSGAEPQGDSKAGKVMEKVGRSIHSAKLAQKGEAKREKAAGLQ